jgi:glutaconate CoA-transferase subunit B
MDYTKQEYMAIATGRELRDGELAIFGVGLSMLAGYFAQKNHAPNLMAFTKGRFRFNACRDFPGELNATGFRQCHKLHNVLSFIMPCCFRSLRCGIIGAARLTSMASKHTVFGRGNPLAGRKYVCPE